MTSNNLDNFNNDYDLELEDNCPITSALFIFGAIISISALLNSKSRKFLFSTVKFLGKQQLKLLAGVGIFSIATFISKNIYSDEDFYDDENEIVLSDFNNKDY